MGMGLGHLSLPNKQIEMIHPFTYKNHQCAPNIRILTLRQDGIAHPTGYTKCSTVRLAGVVEKNWETYSIFSSLAVNLKLSGQKFVTLYRNP